MIHRAARSCGEAFGSLNPEVRETARRAFRLLKDNPRHPGVQFKKTGTLWSARVGLKCRALARDRPYGMLWIGPQDEYERMLS